MDLIEGVIIKELKPILDERGYLQECFRSDWPQYKIFGQSYITVAFPNVVKAWHCHKIQTDNIVCISGNAKLVLYDGREESSTYKKIIEIFFGDKTNCKIIDGFWSDAGTFETLIKSSNFIQSKNKK